MSTDLITPQAPPVQTGIDLDDATLYINREVSWLHFNGRVLEEAMDTSHALLERVKFLAIFAKNLDEFFMIRVAGLRRQVTGGALYTPPDGMTPSEQLVAIRQTLMTQLAQQAECWRHDLFPALHETGIRVCSYHDLQPKQRALLRRVFQREIFPVLTPLAFDPAHPFPHMANLSLNLAVVVNDPQQGERFARLKISDVLPRFVRVPDEDKAEAYEHLGLTEAFANTFVW